MTNQSILRMLKAYNNPRVINKQTFHTWAKTFLRGIARDLGLKPGEYKVWSSLGGIAVGGDSYLHTDRFMIQLTKGFTLYIGQETVDVMYRSCEGMNDFTGGQNQWANHNDMLMQYPTFLRKLENLQCPQA